MDPVDLYGEAVFREKNDFYPVGPQMEPGEPKTDVPELGRAPPELIIQPADLDLSINLLFPKTGEDPPQKASGRRRVQEKDKDKQTTGYPDSLSKDFSQQLHDREAAPTPF